MKKLIGILMQCGLLLNMPIYGLAQNIALNKPVVTSSVQSGSFTGNLAVDGNTSTRWSSAASDPQWIYVDLGSQYNITSVKITWSSAYGKNYTIDVSNNATGWTTIKSISSNTSLTNTNSVTGTGRYVRIYGKQRGTTSGYSIYELQVYGSLSCGTPTGLTSSNITTTSAKVSWTAISGAVTYNLQWKASSSSTWNTVSGITTTSRSLTGLTAGTAYQFQVQTVCSAGTSSYSASTSFTTTASCGTPTGLTSSSITTTSAKVSWTAVSGAVTYNLQWKASSSSTWNTVSGITTTSRSLTGLTAGTAYQFQVQTVCSAGTSSYSASTSFTTTASCGTPTGLTSSSITTTSAKVSWTAISGAVTYNLQWKASSSSTWTTVSGITTTSRSITGLTAGTAYQFQVQTVCSAGTSSYSASTSFTTTASCGMPTGLTSSSVTTTSAKVSWTAVSGAVTYNLQWKASSSSTWTTVSGITTTSRSLTGLTAGTAYQFQVQTICSGGTSSYSASTSFTTTASCGTPTGLTSSSITTTSAKVSWTAVSGAVTYNLQWKASSSSTWTTVSGITTTSRSLTGLTAGTAYQFQVQTVCSAGTSSYSASTSFTTTASCGTPTGLTSSSITTTSAKVSWTAISGAVTYNLQWKASSSSTWTTVSGITTTSRSLTGLTAGTTYQFQVQTVCSAGTSSYSASTSFTTTASCGTPTGLTSSSITNTNATVSWSAISGAVTYNLQWKASSSSTWTTVSGITTTSRSLTGLTAGTAYQFQVQTVCSAGTSSYSASTSLTTTASCGTPTGLTSSNIANTSATVSWTAVSGAVTYNLQWKASSSSTWTTVSGITTTSRSLTGLTAGTAYQFQVQTVCSAGTSSYSASTSFTTITGENTGGTGGGTGKSYYFSTTNGDDSRTSTQAQSPSTPWKTLSKLNSFFSSLQPGDNVYFLRGDTFYGAITFSKSGTSSGGLFFGAYGTGNKPIITGLSDASGWKTIGTNLWESNALTDGQSTAMIVLVNGTSYPMGRWPNATDTWGGFRTISSHNGNSSITDGSLPSSPNWTGATIVMRKNQYVIEKGTVTSQSGTTLSYSSSWNQYSVSDGYGYFIENNINTLNSQNEWYYNPSTKKLDIYSTSTPANVKISTINVPLDLTSKSYLSFDNLDIQGSVGRLMVITGSSHITFTNCDLSNSGKDAIYGGSGTSYFDIENCTINNSNHTAITLDAGASNTIIRNNSISNSAMNPGMLDNYWLTAAVYVTGNNNTIEKNSVQNSGYCGIAFAKGNNFSVKNNFINNFESVLDEGGGIYTYRGTDATVYSNNVVDGNIIINGIGATGGKTNTKGAAQGIYLDNNSQNVTVINNSVANVSLYGIFLLDAHEINILNNTVYNCGTGALALMHNSGNNPVRNVKLRNNKFVMTVSTSIGNWSYQTGAGDLLQFGTSDSNVVATPTNDANAFYTFDGSSYKHQTVSQWQSFSGQDMHSKASPKIVSSLSSLRFEYNASSSSKTVSLGAAYIDINGTSFPSSITLAPYTSTVLISASLTQSIANTTEIVDQINLIEKPSLTIYPNPVTDNFILQLNNSHMGKMDVQVVNQAGSIVRSYLFNKDQIVNQITVPAHDLPTGVYFVHVRIGTWSDNRKIIKL